jgi:YbbR domain-containing protein
MNLSRLLFQSFRTKLLALAIAIATWYVLTGERRERISERSYRIPLSIVNIPAGTLIVSPLPDAVDVRVRGAFTPLRQLEPSKLEAVIDLEDATPGEKRHALEPEDINVPRDVEVIAISPSEMRVVLDAVADKTVPIVPDVTGQPAAGSRVEEVSVEPRQARLLGPARTLDRMVHIKTDPVSVEGRDAPFSVATTLSPPAAGVRVREGQLVTVRVRIRAAPVPIPSPTARPRRK